METKVCTKCGEEKPLHEFYIYKYNTDGRNGRCPECIKEYSRKYYANNKAKHKKLTSDYRKKNLEKILIYQKKYYYEKDRNSINRKKRRQSRHELDDNYIIGLIRRFTGMSTNEIKQRPELIEHKRGNLLRMREARKCKE